VWLQSLVEQAWTQILAEDYEGAAGNMFSLHTDFFKHAFKPESYIIRTVAYLNLCQYGDALNVLKNLKMSYAPLTERLAAYKAMAKGPKSHYDTVKSWLKNQDLKEVDGLPRKFIVELARHPSFILVQKTINDNIDEADKFNKISKDLIEFERTLIKKINDAHNKLAEVHDKLEKVKNEEEQKQLMTAQKYQQTRLVSYKVQQNYAKRARNALKDLRTTSLARLDKEKSELVLRASSTLKERFAVLEKELGHFLDQGDVLQYEIFSGAGEHIRYQMAGGETTGKARPELKAQEGKSQTWGFKGEIWEDEIGHYRSSLKNVCPKEEAVTISNSK
jgi:hypothetical protein